MSIDSNNLHPNFPIVSGQYQLTSIWSVSLPLKFNRQIEEGSLILWRPSLTLYFNVWNNNHNESIDTRLAQLKQGISTEAFELHEQSNICNHRLSYQLIEDEIHALYGFVLAKESYIQVATYFDNASDINLARSIFASIDE